MSKYKVRRTTIYFVGTDAIITLYRGQIWELVGTRDGDRVHISRKYVSLFISSDELAKNFTEVLT